ncbi:MAG: hypothetical protein PUE13_07190 [Clostridiales bacterium]|nr:hypothetical protein [Clostridiales bacterium]
MENDNFIVDIDPKTGFVMSILNPNDRNRMNWCSDMGCWGKIKTACDTNIPEFHKKAGKHERFILKSI